MSPNPTFTYQATGFRNGQNNSVLLTPVEFNAPASTVSVGTHAITPFNATAQNYDITFVNGALEVNTSLSNSLGSVVSSPASSGQVSTQSEGRSKQTIGHLFKPKAKNGSFKTDRIYISAELPEYLGWEDHVLNAHTHFENVEIISEHTESAQ